MNQSFARLAPAQLEAIATAVERSSDGTLDRGALSTLELGGARAAIEVSIRSQLPTIGQQGVAAVLRAVASERRDSTLAADRRLELVWTGPERDNTGTRDTSVVVRELFRSAERDVLVAGYALFNARPIFEPLAERMVDRPDLRVRLVVNVERGTDGDTEEAVLDVFRRQFRSFHWPDGTLPAMFFDPRSFERLPERRAVMHAKCVLVDDERTFVSSANLTEAAQARNIELGVVVNDPEWTRTVRRQFDELIEAGMLKRL